MSKSASRRLKEIYILCFSLCILGKNAFLVSILNAQNNIHGTLNVSDFFYQFPNFDSDVTVCSVRFGYFVRPVWNFCNHLIVCLQITMHWWIKISFILLIRYCTTIRPRKSKRVSGPLRRHLKRNLSVRKHKHWYVSKLNHECQIKNRDQEET